MNKTVILLSILLCCLAPGCAPKETGHGTGGPLATASSAYPDAPPGMSIGNGYISALNEQCYELLPAGGMGEASGAACLRGRTWTVLSPIFASLPGNPSKAGKP